MSDTDAAVRLDAELLVAPLDGGRVRQAPVG